MKPQMVGVAPLRDYENFRSVCHFVFIVYKPQDTGVINTGL